jgi:hypothetical protein
MVTMNEQEQYNKKFELMKAIGELNMKEEEMKSNEEYKKTYLWSIFMPPIGIYYCIKYIFFTRGGSKNIQAGIVSLVLTLLSLIISSWAVIGLFKQSTSSLSPNDLQMINNLAAPDTRKELLQLYK